MLPVFIALAATVYASVGHGGASAYLAILSLYGRSPAEMSTSALVLNVLVAGVATIAYGRAGHLSVGLAAPFVVASVPAAYVGGLLQVSPRVYGLLLGAALLFAAGRLWWTTAERPTKPLSWWLSIPTGAAIGLLSGIVGVGGGIFLSPLMILAGWAQAKPTAAVSALFIVVNSLAGLGGRAARGVLVLGDLGPVVMPAFVGGLVGSWIGARRLPPIHLRRVLAVILLTVAVKSVWTWLAP